MELKINPDIERFIQPLNEAQFETLKRGIQKDGLLSPIEVMFDGTIIDGHHRYRACKELKIKPEIRIVEKIKTVEEAIDYTYKVNIIRRHMNPYQIVEWAQRKLLREEQEKAKYRQTELAKEQRPLPSKEGKGETAEIVAKEVGLGRATLERGLKVIEKASEETKEKLRKGELAIGGVYEQLRLLEEIPIEKQDEIKEKLQSEELTMGELGRIVRISKAVTGILDEIPENIKEEAMKEIGKTLWTSAISLEEVKYRIASAQGNPTPLKRITIQGDIFKDETDATSFAKKCGGKFITKTTLWVLEVDPYLYEKVKSNVQTS